MMYENYRQAAEYLTAVLADPSTARQHQVILKLPEAVQRALLKEDNDAMRRLLGAKETRIPYAEDIEGEATPEALLRLGPSAGTVNLSDAQFSLLGTALWTRRPRQTVKPPVAWLQQLHTRIAEVRQSPVAVECVNGSCFLVGVFVSGQTLNYTASATTRWTRSCLHFFKLATSY